jgi:hypothetical protein
MFSRRARNDYDDTARTTTSAPTQQRRTYADDRAYDGGGTTPSAAPVDDDGRRWHHGPTRALVTLLAVGVAGLLAWTTTTIGDGTTGGYWAVYGILAGAGLVMALSQLLGGWTKRGRPAFSPTFFLLAFVPTAIAVLWILLFHQPHSTLWRGNVTSWSSDLGINGFVQDMGGDLLTMLSFGLGLVFGFCFDTRPTLRRTMPPASTTTRNVSADDGAAHDGRDADEPISREQMRDSVREREEARS